MRTQFGVVTVVCVGCAALAWYVASRPRDRLAEARKFAFVVPSSENEYKVSVRAVNSDERLESLANAWPSGCLVCSVDLVGTDVTDKGIAQLGSLPGIRELRLDYCVRVTGVGLSTLAESPTLEELHLWGCRLSNDALPFVGRMPALQVLDLTNTGLTNGFVSQLVSAEKPSPVQVLYINDLLTRKDMIALSRWAPELRELNLGMSMNGDDLMAEIGRFKQLESLSLSSSHVSDRGLESLAANGVLSRLKWINVKETKVTEGMVRSLRERSVGVKIEY